MEDPSFTDELFDTAEKFLEQLRRYQRRWNTSGASWVFRGHANSAWPLIPRLWREQDQKSNPFYCLEAAQKTLEGRNGISVESGESIERAKVSYAAIAAETIGVEAFSHLADDLGFEALHNRSRAGNSPLSSGPTENFKSAFDYEVDDATALSQHHGIATQLLDWTENPLAAAFFASDGWKRKAAESTSPASLCVWAIDVAFLNSPYGLRVHRPVRARNPFLRAQAGLFTWWRGAYGLYFNTGNWPVHIPSQNAEVVSAGMQKRVLAYKMSLPGSEVGELHFRLQHENITLAHLMPTLDNVAHVVIDNGKKWQQSAGPR